MVGTALHGEGPTTRCKGRDRQAQRKRDDAITHREIRKRTGERGGGQLWQSKVLGHRCDDPA